MGEFANHLSIVEERGHDHFEANEVAPFKAADAAPAAPAGEQQVAPEPGSVSKMLLNAKQQKGSRLMSLPAEVRNQIYRFGVANIRCSQLAGWSTQVYEVEILDLPAINLQMINRQFREEYLFELKQAQISPHLVVHCLPYNPIGLGIVNP